MPKTNGVPTFIKWAGGKTQLLEQFDQHFPEEIEHFHEPFVGSGAVFFHIMEKYNPKKSILSDINEELINCYKQVQNNLDKLISELETHEENFLPKNQDDRKEYYYKIRGWDVSTLEDYQRAGRFIFLNRTCFNGLYRVNSKGQFNVPIGSYKNPAILMEDKLKKANKMLQRVELKVQHFKKVLDDTKRGDFVYFDPPYNPLNETSNFTSYTKDTFLEKEQRQLVEVYDRLDEKGCKVMLSNSDTPLIDDLYNHGKYKVEKVKARRMINCDAEKRGAINELLVMNY